MGRFYLHTHTHTQIKVVGEGPHEQRTVSSGQWDKKELIMKGEEREARQWEHRVQMSWGRGAVG